MSCVPSLDLPVNVSWKQVPQLAPSYAANAYASESLTICGAMS
jgi:hypothetical protein